MGTIQQALLQAGLAKESQTPTVSGLPVELCALEEEIKQLAAKLPQGDQPSLLVVLTIHMFASQGKKREALEFARNAMRRRLKELGIE